MFLDHDETSPSIATVSPPSFYFTIIDLHRSLRLARSVFAEINLQVGRCYGDQPFLGTPVHLPPVAREATVAIETTHVTKLLGNLPRGTALKQYK